MNKILILSTQRSGSTMVCDDIEGTGELGKPSEYFIEVITNHEDKNSEQLKESVFKALKKGSFKNSMSIKVMANQIDLIGKILRDSCLTDHTNNQESFFEFFKDWVFVRVIRKDKVAQAVSRVMAEQSKIYHTVDSSNDLKGMLGNVGLSRDESLLSYNFDSIKNEIKNIHNEECLLDLFFERFQLDIFNVFYEDAIEDRSYVNEIASKAGVEKIHLTTRRLKKISLNSDVWINRFLSNQP